MLFLYNGFNGFNGFFRHCFMILWDYSGFAAIFAQGYPCNSCNPLIFSLSDGFEGKGDDEAGTEVIGGVEGDDATQLFSELTAQG